MHLSYVYNIPKLIMFNPFLFVCLPHIISITSFIFIFPHSTKYRQKESQKGWVGKKLQRVKFLILHVQGTYFKNVSWVSESCVEQFIC